MNSFIIGRPANQAECEGRAEALPVSHVIAGAPEPPQFMHEDLPRIAVRLTLLIWIAVLTVPIAYLIIPQCFDIMAIGTTAVFHIWGVTTACQLARIMHKPVWLWAALTLLPFVNLFAFARIVSQAALVLKGFGIRTGIAGVARSEIERYGSPGPNAPVEIWKSSLKW